MHPHVVALRRIELPARIVLAVEDVLGKRRRLGAHGHEHVREQVVTFRNLAPLLGGVALLRENGGNARSSFGIPDGIEGVLFLEAHQERVVPVLGICATAESNDRAQIPVAAADLVVAVCPVLGLADGLADGGVKLARIVLLAGPWPARGP